MKQNVAELIIALNGKLYKRKNSKSLNSRGNHAGMLRKLSD
jgi:hypothetical protein